MKKEYLSWVREGSTVLGRRRSSVTKWGNGWRCCCCSSAPLGNGSRRRRLRRCTRRRVGCCSLVMVLTRRESLRNFYGFWFPRRRRWEMGHDGGDRAAVHIGDLGVVHWWRWSWRGEGSWDIFLGLGFCFGRVTGLKRKGKWEKRNFDGDENVPRVTKQKCSDTVTVVGSMNSVKILSDRNWVMKANGCEKLSDEWWVMSDDWWVMSDDWWVMEIEWRKLSDQILLAKQALSFSRWRLWSVNGLKQMRCDYRKRLQANKERERERYVLWEEETKLRLKERRHKVS